MKKYFILVILFIWTPVLIFSETENGISIGFGYDFAFSRYKVDNDKIDSYLASPNIILSTFLFSDENKIGFFMNSTLLGFPQSITYNINGSNEKKDYNSGLQSGMVLGTAFRYKINDKLIFQPGAGIHFLIVAADYSEFILLYNKTVSFKTCTIDLGIGGDIGLRYRIANNIILNIGTIITSDFFRYIIINSSDERLTTNGIAKDFIQFRVRPYISFGINIH